MLCAGLLALGLTACATGPTVVAHEPEGETLVSDFLTDEGLWLSDRFEELDSGHPEIGLFVETEFKTRPLHFFIVNTDPRKNDFTFFHPRNGLWPVYHREQRLIDGQVFETQVMPFHFVRGETGDFYKLINQTRFAAPNCGLTQQFRRQEDTPYHIYVIKVVRCAQMAMDFRQEERSNLYKNSQALKDDTMNWFGWQVDP